MSRICCCVILATAEGGDGCIPFDFGTWDSGSGVVRSMKTAGSGVGVGSGVMRSMSSIVVGARGLKGGLIGLTSMLGRTSIFANC
jgi:hypothetical protein